MSRSKFILLLYFIGIVGAVGLIYYSTTFNDVEYTRNDVVTYEPGITGVASYSQGDSQNLLVCNYTTVNLIISNMISEYYYVIINDQSTDSVMDLTLQNDNDTCRVVYNRQTRDLLFVSSDFLRNRNIELYIHERW